MIAGKRIDLMSSNVPLSLVTLEVGVEIHGKLKYLDCTILYNHMLRDNEIKRLFL